MQVLVSFSMIWLDFHSWSQRLKSRIRQDEFSGGGSLEGTIGRVQFSVVVLLLLFPVTVN